MSMTDNCSCKKKKCPRHGDCVACEEFHKMGKRPPYCKRPKLFGHRIKT